MEHRLHLKNLSGVYKKQKERLTLLIDELDLKAEHTPLTVSEREIKKEADCSLAKLMRDEETKWAQRAKVKHIQEGGIIRGTSTLFLTVNIKRKRSFS